MSIYIAHQNALISTNEATFISTFRSAYFASSCYAHYDTIKFSINVSNTAAFEKANRPTQYAAEPIAYNTTIFFTVNPTVGTAHRAAFTRANIPAIPSPD